MFTKLKMTLFVGAFLLSLQTFANELNIYSVYPADELAAVFEPFTEQTGIKINVLSGKSGDLLDRLIQEGEHTPADLHLDKDLVYHGQATRAGLYQPFSSKMVEKTVPSHLMESGQRWLHIFYRSRVIMYNSEKVDPSELSTYADLGNEKWEGRLCLRTSTKSYNKALGSYLVVHHGPDKAREIMTGWANNLAMEPTTSDRDVIRAINDGTCDVGVANSYYLPAFIEADPNYPVRPFFANQETTKAHINGVGIGIIKYSDKVEDATRLIEYLVSTPVQSAVADAFKQYPVNPEASLNPTVQNFGSFMEDETNVGIISNFTDLASELMKEAGYN